MLLNKQTLQNLKIRKTVEVHIDGLDGKAKFRELGGVERFSYITRLKDLSNEEGGIDFNKLPDFAELQVDLVASCLIDQSDALIVENDEDKEFLKNLPHSVLDEMFSACQDLNGFSADEEEEKN